MIISHRNRFIFIKTRKTAGSSLEVGLSRACGPEDIITPLSANRGEEELRRAEGGQGPTNCHKRPLEHRGWKEWRRLLFRGRRTEYPQHARAPQIRSFIGPGIWHSYFRFTIERNPWDRALSRYWWQKHRWEEKGRDNFPSLSEYLAWLEEHKPHWLSNWDHYTIDDEIAVDRVLRYEKLNDELTELQQELGLGTDIRLPEQRAKSGFRQGRQDYREILSDADRAVIDRVCRREIAAFGYRFEDG
ncbi:sulfotransferase family 2 domain-containing protein [Thioalkalivibrio sp. ALR17-21]|uniref:sulfotransferase family 2 domain-containing protein n=1 Tax=Thioalkalivibrio sp. ALR17-21 TaxID=1269813 RepID=UPI0003FD756C|nr:sulfotransferase family 2 domain-containing protein [Thioalkalivibrio sp. ALR17-21]